MFKTLPWHPSTTKADTKRVRREKGNAPVCQFQKRKRKKEETKRGNPLVEDRSAEFMHQYVGSKLLLIAFPRSSLPSQEFEDVDQAENSRMTVEREGSHTITIRVVCFSSFAFPRDLHNLSTL